MQLIFLTLKEEKLFYQDSFCVLFLRLIRTKKILA